MTVHHTNIWTALQIFHPNDGPSHKYIDCTSKFPSKWQSITNILTVLQIFHPNDSPSHKYLDCTSNIPSKWVHHTNILTALQIFHPNDSPSHKYIDCTSNIPSKRRSITQISWLILQIFHPNDRPWYPTNWITLIISHIRYTHIKPRSSHKYMAARENYIFEF